MKAWKSISFFYSIFVFVVSILFSGNIFADDSLAGINKSLRKFMCSQFDARSGAASNLPVQVSWSFVEELSKKTGVPDYELTAARGFLESDHDDTVFRVLYKNELTNLFTR